MADTYTFTGNHRRTIYENTADLSGSLPIAGDGCRRAKSSDALPGADWNALRECQLAAIDDAGRNLQRLSRGRFRQRKHNSHRHGDRRHVVSGYDGRFREQLLLRGHGPHRRRVKRSFERSLRAAKSPNRADERGGCYSLRGNAGEGALVMRRSVNWGGPRSSRNGRGRKLEFTLSGCGVPEFITMVLSEPGLWFRVAMKEYWTLRVRADKVKLGARSLARMFGSFLRDGGVLVIVFGILDKYERPNSLPNDWVANCWRIGLGCLFFGLIFGLIGGDS
jgi:hypothetical protein